MRKKFLIFATLFIVIVGLLATCVPVIDSLSSNEVSLNKLPHIDISAMNAGEIKEYRGAFLHVFITKVSGIEKYSLVAIPHWGGDYRLPEFDWGRPVLPCSDFGITSESVYTCRDTGDFWWGYMKWNLEGKYTGENKWGFNIPDLIKPKHKLRAGNIILLES